MTQPSSEKSDPVNAQEPLDTVLITGASAGLGWELSHCFGAEAKRLVVVARREDRLRELAGELEKRYGVQVKVCATDLTEPRAVQKLIEELEAEAIQVDGLVNNAGFGARGAFVELDLDRQLAMIQLNVNALVELTGRLLPGMVERGRGGIVNVASTAAFQPGPKMAVYYATKAFVLSFSEALYEELKATGITVSCLAPGPTQTEFGAVSGMEGSTAFRLGTMAAQPVAEAGHRGLKRNRALTIPGLRNRLLVFAGRFAPRWLLRKIIKRIQ